MTPDADPSRPAAASRRSQPRHLAVRGGWRGLSRRVGVRVRVRLALLAGRPALALGCLDTALQQQADDAWALASRSLLLQQAGQLDHAIADARALVAAHPRRSGDDWFNLGFLLESADQPGPAAAAFRRATELSPQLDRAWYGLGLALIGAGRLTEAEAALRRCTELQPLGPNAWYQLGRLLADLGRADEAAALIRRLDGFEPAVAGQLRREIGA